MLQPFGPRLARFIRRSPREDATINLLVGAIRSGKTVAINAKFVAMLTGAYGDWSWPGGIGLVSAKSKTSARTNMLGDVFDLVGGKNYRYNQQSGELLLLGKKFLVCGASDESSWKAIRGSTVGLWIADEVSLYPKSFFDMARSRLSLVGSRMYGSTNPDSPYHYLKRDYIDDEQKLSNRDFWYENYNFEDNPSLAESKREEFQRMYTGVFRRRYILGEWCIAEGAIYRDVLTDDIFYDDQTRPIGLLSQGGHRERWIAIDVGTMNPQVYIDAYDDGTTLWLEREYYYDGRALNRQKTDKEYANDLILGCPSLNWPGFPPDQRRWPGVIIDPSAASFRAELLSRGVYVIDADNDVDNGIRRVSAMLGRKRLRLHRKNCPNGVREMQTYAWDEKKAENGKEQPIKSQDHFPDGTRYLVNTRISDWRIAA